jgi:hypothetical protein
MVDCVWNCHIRYHRCGEEESEWNEYRKMMFEHANAAFFLVCHRACRRFLLSETVINSVSDT